MASAREHMGLRPFFAISYLRVLKVFVWVSHGILQKFCAGFP